MYFFPPKVIYFGPKSQNSQHLQTRIIQICIKYNFVV